MLFRKITPCLLLFFGVFFSNAQQSIDGFTLMNADTDSPITELTNDIQINSQDLAGVNLNIRANTNPQLVGSVLLTLSGQVAASRNENVAPYALFGDISGDYLPGNLPLGSYVLSATPFTGANQTGTAGDSRTIQFSIVIPNPNL
ncbi:hypothetical protein M3P19_06335, partial [Muricauda sp. 2012CJ35-5]